MADTEYSAWSTTTLRVGYRRGSSASTCASDRWPLTVTVSATSPVPLRNPISGYISEALATEVALPCEGRFLLHRGDEQMCRGLEPNASEIIAYLDDIPTATTLDVLRHRWWGIVDGEMEAFGRCRITGHNGVRLLVVPFQPTLYALAADWHERITARLYEITSGHATVGEVKVSDGTDEAACSTEPPVHEATLGHNNPDMKPAGSGWLWHDERERWVRYSDPVPHTGCGVGWQMPEASAPACPTEWTAAHNTLLDGALHYTEDALRRHMQDKGPSMDVVNRLARLLAIATGDVG